jgi:hypothetical protein
MPPAHLPPLILECESGPGYNACSVWMWHGTGYGATWSSGEVGQLTVASADAPGLRVDRVDTAGGMKGLTAIYTGQWTGSAVNAGKMTATFKGGSNTFTWTGTPAATPVLKNPGLDYNYVNWYAAQLTAYAIVNPKGVMAMSPGVLSNDYRLRGEAPMNPGQTRLLTNRGQFIPGSALQGKTYQETEAIAAIYSDGTTFGDRNVLKAMLDTRRSMIDALTGIGGTICRLGMQQASLQDIGAALDKEHADEDAHSAAGRDGRRIAYDFVSKSLFGHDSGRLPANKAVQRIWNQVNQLRSDLASDPIKDAAGQLVIPAVTPLQCNLP